MLLNIIYTPGTVKYLWPMAKTFLNESEIKLRLVSNYCSEEENNFLHQLSKKFDKIVFYKIDTDRILPHCKVLNTIFILDNEEWFSIADSDIFTTGPILQKIKKILQHNLAFFSCKPLLTSPKSPEIDLIQGRHFHDRNNNLVGGSYFAIYRKKELKEFMRKNEVSFTRIQWPNIREDHQKLLLEKNLRYKQYDTSKLLNILLSLNDKSFHYEELPELNHIGGLSWSKSRVDNNPNFDVNKINHPELIPIITKRRIVAKYFTDLIEALVDNSEVPDHNILKNLEVNNNIENVVNKIKILYN